MALVKTTRIAATPGPAAAAEGSRPPARSAARMAPSLGQPSDKISERIAAATEELASGLTEASAAAEELRRAMEQIASGAEEAAGGSQEQVGAIKTVLSDLTAARAQAQTSRGKTESVQLVLVDTCAQIITSVRAIERNAERQRGSVAVTAELERRAKDIGEITRTVGRISDQTNLLALNAAIEAARAGDHGRGFAVVAEEVMALAETSEKRARAVQELAQTIAAEVQGVAATIKASADAATVEAANGVEVVEALESIQRRMAALTKSSDDTLTATLQAERAALEARRGAEQVAGAAEVQAAAATEAQTAIQQQALALEQGQVAARSLATLAETLQRGGADPSTPEQIAAAAEELSATIQELSTAAAQIMAAVDQISRGAELQAGATHQTSSALTEIEASAVVARDNAATSTDEMTAVEATLAGSRASVQRLMAGVTRALEGGRSSLAIVIRLESVGRRIDTIVDAIGIVGVQTTMLAVSGSVEAARAGEAGRGFALVSTDIRKLAREASESVERVKDTVRGILDQISSLRRDLEQIISTTELEVQTNRAIFTALARLDDDISGAGAANRGIRESAQSITTATTQTAAAARQIAAAAEEASASARQAATAADQQARGAEDLAAAIEEIASLADDLKPRNG